ncbi:MAG: 4Fe-4S dicluster domain-containing protein [Bacteroidales bacterium]|jgi:reductive dehalogenase|nr:4Fe-4S dicluster domain-containing protein [Bacteroidales bacterium]
MISNFFHILIFILILISLVAGIISIFENEKRASLIFIVISLSILSFLLITNHLPDEIAHYTKLISIGVFMLLLIIFTLPISGTKRIQIYQPKDRIDERITMFSRSALQAESLAFHEFYNSYPDLQKIDAKWRQNPGLLSPESKFFDRFHFAAAEASFRIIAENRKQQLFKPTKTASEIDVNQMKKHLKTWSKQLGAQAIGFTALKTYHRYSHRGYGENYGKPISQNHNFAIAILVPMSHKAVQKAPLAPTVSESANQYVKSGIIALQIAAFLSELGYEAKAHIDGGYDLVLPLVAQDAGLGTIGRMGIMISEKTGPRCRIAVVSTNLKLNETQHKAIDKSIISFCNICKKCANVCPSAAISKKKRETINGITRWQINQEACYTYWTKSGTDCARCMAACPYSHPNNILHSGVRFLIKRNVLFRHLAIKLDDVFYGKRPKSK